MPRSNLYSLKKKNDVDTHFLKVVLGTQFTTGTLPVKIDRWLKLTPSQPRRISLSGRFQSRNKWHRYNDCRMSRTCSLSRNHRENQCSLCLQCSLSYTLHFSKTFHVNTAHAVISPMENSKQLRFFL